MSVSALLRTLSLSQSPFGPAGPLSTGSGPPGLADGLTIGDLLAAVSLPNFLPSTRIWMRAALPLSTLSSCAGTVTTNLVFVAVVARAKAVPPPRRTKKTRVLPLPGTKLLPFTVSFSPTLSFIGLIDLTTGALEAAEAPAVEASRALMSAPRQRTTRREFIDPVFGRRSYELERSRQCRTARPAQRLRGTTRSPTCTDGVPARNPRGRGGKPRSPARATSCAAARSDTAEMVSEGFTPSDDGMALESMQKSPSLSNTSQRWSTTPSSLVSAIRQPPSGCAQYTPRVSLSFMKRASPRRSATCRIALSASARTRSDSSESW